MKKTIMILLAACMLAIAIGCKPKAENDTITFAANVTGFEEEGFLVETSADVGFTTALVHLAEGYTPDFTIKAGQAVQLTILPMMTKSIPPQVTATEAKLIAEAPENGVASVTEGLDPMPMLTPGTDAVTDAEAPDTLEAHMADMLPVLDAVTRTMGVDGTRGYLPADPVFVWQTLSNLCEAWGHTAPEITLDGEELIVPADTMRAFALAACNRTDALPPLPADVSDQVRYDEASGAYRVARSASPNDSATGIDAFSDNGDGTYSATLGYYTSAGERLGGVVFTLADAPEANGAYRFVVTNAQTEA